MLISKNKKYLSFLSTLFFVALIISCDKTTVSKIDPDVDINGRWELVVVRNSVDLKNGEDTNRDDDFSGQGLFFEFNSNGTYETNASINLGSVSKSDDIISGTYIKGEKDLQLQYSFEDFGIDANIILDIATLSNDELIVVVTEQTLIQAFDDNLGTLNAFERAAAELFLGNLVELETRIEMAR